MPTNPIRTIELPCVVAATLWTVTLLLFAGGASVQILSHANGAGSVLLTASVLLCGASCVASVRVLLIHHYRAVSSVFDLGREVGQAQAAVPLQRIH